MHKEEEFELFTFAEEVSYSISCLEKLCLDLNILNKNLVACIDIFWGYTKKDTDCWETDIYFIKNNSSRIERYQLGNTGEEIKKSIESIIQLLIQLCLGSLYTRYRYTVCLNEILKIEKILEENKVECPEVKFYIGREKFCKGDLKKIRNPKYNLKKKINFRSK